MTRHSRWSPCGFPYEQPTTKGHAKITFVEVEDYEVDTKCLSCMCDGNRIEHTHSTLRIKRLLNIIQFCRQHHMSCFLSPFFEGYPADRKTGPAKHGAALPFFETKSSFCRRIDGEEMEAPKQAHRPKFLSETWQSHLHRKKYSDLDIICYFFLEEREEQKSSLFFEGSKCKTHHPSQWEPTRWAKKVIVERGNHPLVKG